MKEGHMMKVLALVLITAFSFNGVAGEESLYDFLWLDPDKKV
jgi:hypothetical protein